MQRLIRWLPIAFLVVAACGDDSSEVTDGPVDAAVDADGDAPGFRRTIPVVLNRDVDLLFVVDNSGSMQAEQQQLTDNFPAFINTLVQVSGGLPNLHLGVLSSNVGAAGAASVPGCPLSGDDGNLLTGPPLNTCAAQFGLQGTFISDVAQPDGTRIRNYVGDLPGLFSCMAQLGTSGCGFEQHLESMYRSLQPGKNPGFLRTAAHLVVIFLADEDDCSTELGTMFGDPGAGITSPLGPRTSFRCFEFGVVCDDDPTPRAFGTKTGCEPRTDSMYMYEVQRYIDFARSLKDGAGTGQLVVAGILGNFDASTGEVAVGPDPNTPTFPNVQKSCFTNDPNDPDDGATPPVRLQSFLSAFPDHNVNTTICNANLTDAMVAVGEQVKNAIGNPCIDAQLADQDPGLPGVQPSCTVMDVIDPDGPNRVAVELAACAPMVQQGASCAPGGGATPCWCILQNAPSCPVSAQNPLGFSLGVNRNGAGTQPGQVYELFCRVP